MSNEASWSQANHTLTLVGQQKPTFEHIKTLHGGVLTDLVQAIMNGSLPSREEVREFYGLEPLQTETVEAPPVSATTHTGILTVDYGRNLEQMIAAGHYGADGNNWSKNITAERFPVSGTGSEELEFKVFDLGRNVSSGDAVEAIKADDEANPWKPARTEHILAYGAQFPEEQKKSPVIGLGSVGEARGNRDVLALDVDYGVRRLSLRWWGYDWNANCRFLAVRKKPSAS